MKKEIGYIGLGKMGLNMTTRLVRKGYRVIAYDVAQEARARARRAGAKIADSIREAVLGTQSPRTVWVMVPHGVVDRVLAELFLILNRGDTIIEGGNSFYEDTIRRAKRARKNGIHFIDVGVSGGPSGALKGACLMIGGEKRNFTRHKPLFRDLAVKDGFAYLSGYGAGHFAKMVHNGIEYGMMQAIAEGFAVLKKSPYRFDLRALAELYNHGSVIESRLIEWLRDGYKAEGGELKKISGSVGHTGEGEWTVQTAKKLGIPVSIIEESFAFRLRSKKKPSYAGKVLSLLRSQFGGHRSRK